MPSANGRRLNATLDLLVTVLIGVAAVLLIWRLWNEPANPIRSTRSEPVEDIASASLVTSITGAPNVGSDAAPVVLIEYADFECPFCARHAAETFGQIDREFVTSGRVQYVFRHFPIGAIHPSAVMAARATTCAHRQGGFLQMREYVYARQTELAQIDWVRISVELGLDARRFEDCLIDVGEEEIEAEMQEGARLGVSATPQFLIGRRGDDGRIQLVTKVNGALQYSRFRDALERAIGG